MGDPRGTEARPAATEGHGGEADPVMRLLSRICRPLAMLAGGLFFLAAILFAVDITLRAALNTSLGGADEVVGYLLAVGFAFGCAFTLLEKGHIRIVTLYRFLPARGRSAADVAVLALTTLVLGYVLYAALGTLGETLALGARSATGLRTPLWLPQLVWVIGLATFALCSAALTLRALQRWRAGDDAFVRRSIGAELGLPGESP